MFKIFYTFEAVLIFLFNYYTDLSASKIYSFCSWLGVIVLGVLCCINNNERELKKRRAEYEEKVARRRAYLEVMKDRGEDIEKQVLKNARDEAFEIAGGVAEYAGNFIYGIWALLNLLVMIIGMFQGVFF